MKKNFMAIASLLIAAMLLVVSCAPEAKVENNDVANDLVDVKLSVAFGKAVKIDTADEARIQYKYTLTPKWDALTEGKDPYGKTTSEVVDLFDKGLLDEDQVRLKVNFTPYIKRFERENIDIVSFAAGRPMREKVSTILQTLQSYVSEEKRKSAGEPQT